MSNPPRCGRKRRANAPPSVNTATFFIHRTVEQCRFKQFDVRFFVSINVFLCNSARIIVKTSRRDDMHQFIFYQLKSPHLREFAIQGKKMLMLGGKPGGGGGGGGGWAQLELTDALQKTFTSVERTFHHTIPATFDLNYLKSFKATSTNSPPLVQFLLWETLTPEQENTRTEFVKNVIR